MTELAPGFLWGASTAPHQIEGNNLNSDFWASEGRVPGMERYIRGAVTAACSQLVGLGGRKSMSGGTGVVHSTVPLLSARAESLQHGRSGLPQVSEPLNGQGASHVQP